MFIQYSRLRFSLEQTSRPPPAAGLLRLSPVSPSVRCSHVRQRRREFAGKADGTKAPPWLHSHFAVVDLRSASPATPSAASLEAARRRNCAALSAGPRHRPCLFFSLDSIAAGSPSPPRPQTIHPCSTTCAVLVFLSLRFPTFLFFLPCEGKKEDSMEKKKAVNQHNETGGGVSCLAFIRGGNEHPEPATIGLVLISCPLTP